MTYFPKHLSWPDLLFRLYRAGWRITHMAKAMVHARGTLTKVEVGQRNDALRHTMRTAGRDHFGPTFGGAAQGPFRDDPYLVTPVKMEDFPLTQYPNGILEYYDVSEAEPVATEKKMNENASTLQQVYNGVVNHPQGSHRGLVTRALDWAARQTPAFVKPTGEEYTVLDIMDIVKAQRFQLPNAAKTAQWDLEGLVYMTKHVPDPLY